MLKTLQSRGYVRVCHYSHDPSHARDREGGAGAGSRQDILLIRLCLLTQRLCLRASAFTVFVLRLLFPQVILVPLLHRDL